MASRAAANLISAVTGCQNCVIALQRWRLKKEIFEKTVVGFAMVNLALCDSTTISKDIGSISDEYE